jgi:ubiquinone biosynthesis protein
VLATPARIALRALQLAAAAALAAVVFAAQAWRERRDGREGLLRAAGRAAVALCARLGATFIKIGQIASTRADLIPRPFVEELAALQDRVPAFPFERVRETLARELGRPPEEVFARLDPEPVAAASVAQVHRGVLRAGGELVAVKVRRPDIAEKVRLDRTILLFVARLLERVVPTLRLVSLEEAVRQFCVAVEEQLHLEHEARNNERFTADFADDPDVRFPRLHPEACSDSVLTMEFIEGIREADLEAAGVDVHRVVEAGMRAVCRMVFLHGFVHADLHPGNVRFVPPGAVVLLDLGLVGRLGEEDRLSTARLLHAFATGDGRTVARLFHDLSPRARTRDYAAYEAEIVQRVDHVRERGLAHLQVALEIGRLFDILRRHRIQARSHMTLVNLALMTAEGMGKRLAPELSLTDAALPYLAEALCAGASPPPPARG